MIDIILLMDEPEAQFFQGKIAMAAPGLKCRQVSTLQELESAVRQCSDHARLISFCADIIVPEPVLQLLKFNCYNFHPGPPERKGYRPAHFAAHEGVDTFGVTLHRMAPKVDDGDIVGARRFTLAPPMSIEAIELLTYEALVKLAVDLMGNLARVDRILEPIDEDWSGKPTTRRQWLDLPPREIDITGRTA